ncbi:catalase-related domain-containing protein [Kitasatospora sp. NPDC086009]|uniref:catalase-related domain-containing protein n=1 Tax=unclassified Kitasatospora TaxID=2633591 RepID=UPI0037CA5EDA
MLDDAQRDRLVSNIVGHLKAGVSDPVLARAVQYWRNVDKSPGGRVASGAGSPERAVGGGAGRRGVPRPRVDPVPGQACPVQRSVRRVQSPEGTSAGWTRRRAATAGPAR